MDFLRRKNFAQRGSSESSAGEKKPSSPSTPPSPFPSPTTTPTPPSNLKPPTRPPLPPTSPLPTDPALLEGLQNHHASQLKKLADRTESMNEWIEMDGIVLARLVDEMTQRIEREDARKAKAIEASPLTPTTPPYRTPTVHFSTSSPPIPPTLEDRIASNGEISHLRDRIRSAKKWRRELERSVVWQRGEHARVEKVMGKGKLDVVVEEEGWGVGGKTWERGSGRLPTGVEWEGMFGGEGAGIGF